MTAAAITVLACAAGCGGSASAAAAPVYVAAAIATAAARRSQGACYTECEHHTHCDVETGLCEPGERPRTARARSTSTSTSTTVTASADAEAEAFGETPDVFVCDLGDGEHQTVHALTREGAREVCLASNDVDPAGGACTCERQSVSAR